MENIRYGVPFEPKVQIFFCFFESLASNIKIQKFKKKFCTLGSNGTP
jgi:hypothetical protein